MGYTGERECPICHKKRPTAMFISDYRKNDEYLLICERCRDDILEKVSKLHGLMAGVWTLCMMNHVPMIKSIWNQTVKNMVAMRKNEPFEIYYSTLKEVYGKYSGVWESDLCFSLPSPEEEEETVDDNGFDLKLTMEELQQAIKIWGKFVNENGEIDHNAYSFLIERYNQYTESVEGLTDAMAMQFRNLCKAEWQKIKADESGDITEIDRAQKLVDRLLSALKLDDFAVEKSDIDRFIDRLIWRIEETEPAEIEDEKQYVDIAGHERTYNAVMRSLRNIVANSKEYPEVPTEEM